MGQPPLIDLHGVTRTFGAFTALHGVTLQLPQGRTGLLGPNGAGKSTLLKILMGLIEPSAGSGRVLDQPLGGDRDSAANWRLRRLIGFMPEAEALVPGLTGIEYVGLAGELYGMSRRQSQRRAHEVLGYLGLEEARYRKVEEYSAGMKQRAKLAQALVHDPPVLLLDEPTSGLDPAGRDALLNLVRELGTDHGKSVVLSTHLLADVQAVCERVVILAGGVVRGQGTVEELCAAAPTGSSFGCRARWRSSATTYSARASRCWPTTATASCGCWSRPGGRTWRSSSSPGSTT